MKRSILVVLLAALPLLAGDRTIDLDPARTKIAFTLADVLHTVHGTFQLKRGTIHFDSVTGQAGGEIVVDVASGNTGGSARDKRMHKDILESGRFPEAVFVPDHVTGALAPRGESQLDVHGVFQMHGGTHEVTFHFRATVEGNDVATSTAFPIPYVQWGMKNPSNFLLKVSDKVEMEIHAAGSLR